MTPSSSCPSVAPLSAAPLPPWKRALDLTCCACALPLLALAYAGVALLLSLTAPGPVFFRQERIGYGGRRFLLYKFRTMHVGADTGAHQAHVAALLQSNAPLRKLDGARDRRLVPGAWLLRVTGLDELPQILNVLRREMSIVGPRPCLPYEYAQYTAWHRQRCRALPGLTGLWQVSGKNRTTFDEMIRLDVRYAQTRSLRGDVAIILRTVPALWMQYRDTRRERRRPVAPARPPVGSRPSVTFQT